MNTNDKRIAVLHAANDKRYRKLRFFLTNAGYFSHDTESGVIRTYVGPAFYGPTFDAAVDALPEPDTNEAAP